MIHLIKILLNSSRLFYFRTQSYPHRVPGGMAAARCQSTTAKDAQNLDKLRGKERGAWSETQNKNDNLSSLARWQQSTTVVSGTEIWASLARWQQSTTVVSDTEIADADFPRILTEKIPPPPPAPGCGSSADPKNEKCDLRWYPALFPRALFFPTLSPCIAHSTISPCHSACCATQLIFMK